MPAGGCKRPGEWPRVWVRCTPCSSCRWRKSVRAHHLPVLQLAGSPQLQHVLELESSSCRKGFTQFGPRTVVGPPMCPAMHGLCARSDLDATLQQTPEVPGTPRPFTST